MKLVGIISTAVLSLALGVAVPAFTQDREQDDKTKPAQDEKKAQPEKSAKQEDKSVKPEEKNAQQENNVKPEEKNAQQENKNNQQEQKNAEQQDRNNHPEQMNAQQHEQPAQRAGGNGAGRIPDDRYKANFGREHTFRVSQGDYSSGRFQYGGYWFGFAGAWPSNWLYTQDVYVIEINGMYYLCNPMYPGVNLAINVTL